MIQRYWLASLCFCLKCKIHTIENLHQTIDNSDTLNNKVQSTYVTIDIDNEAQFMSSPFITEGSEVVKNVKKINHREKLCKNCMKIIAE